MRRDVVLRPRVSLVLMRPYVVRAICDLDVVYAFHVFPLSRGSCVGTTFTRLCAGIVYTTSCLVSPLSRVSCAGTTFAPSCARIPQQKLCWLARLNTYPELIRPAPWNTIEKTFRPETLKATQFSQIHNFDNSRTIAVDVPNSPIELCTYSMLFCNISFVNAPPIGIYIY